MHVVPPQSILSSVLLSSFLRTFFAVAVWFLMILIIFPVHCFRDFGEGPFIVFATFLRFMDERPPFLVLTLFRLFHSFL